jgi:hypothetical protein
LRGLLRGLLHPSTLLLALPDYFFRRSLHHQARQSGLFFNNIRDLLLQVVRPSKSTQSVSSLCAMRTPGGKGLDSGRRDGRNSSTAAEHAAGTRIQV